MWGLFYRARHLDNHGIMHCTIQLVVALLQLLVAVQLAQGQAIEGNVTDTLRTAAAADLQVTTSTDVACLSELVRAVLQTDPCMGMGANGTQGGMAMTDDEYVAARFAELNNATNLGLANCGNTLRMKVSCWT